MDDLVIFNALQTSMSGGIGRYSYELAKSLYMNSNLKIKIVIREEDLDLFNFANKKDLIIAQHIKNSLKRNYYEQFVLPKIIKRNYPKAIIHYPDSMAPLLSKNKVVITIHDLAFKALKNVFTFKTVAWKSLTTYLSVKKANKIIAITNFTASEIYKVYGDDLKNKVNVVYNGFNDFSKEKIDENNVREELKTLKNKNYILTVSTISPRKNINTLIKSFNKIKDKINYNLIICGKNGWMYEDVYKLVEELNLKERVFFTGKVNDDELKHIYKNANIFTYLSIYEGFGLPPLEAMSYGVPCIVSNTSSIPEVVGESCKKLDALDIEEISNNILKIIGDKNLICEMKNKGFKRLRDFSWDKCCRKVNKVYNNLSYKEKVRINKIG